MRFYDFSCLPQGNRRIQDKYGFFTEAGHIDGELECYHDVVKNSSFEIEICQTKWKRFRQHVKQHRVDEIRNEYS